MLLVYSPENSWTPDEWNSCLQESVALCHELAALGQFHGASPLHPVATAHCVRLRDGQRLVTAGPFAETTEQLGGYYIVDVPNLDDAIAIACRIPAVKKGTVEIRPLFPLDGLPAEKPGPASGDLRQFLLICYDDEEYWTAVGPDVHLAAMREAAEVTRDLDSRGRYLSASPLRPVSTATSVRLRDGRRIVTDGPFAETREILGGYYLILAQHPGEAVDLAARHPGTRVGTVEVRQVYTLTDLPESNP